MFQSISAMLNRLWAQPYLVLSAAALFWAGNFVVGRWATAAGVSDLPPIQLAFLRWSLACLLTLPFAMPALRRDWPKLTGSRRQLARTLILAILGYSSFNTLLYLGLKDSSVANAAILSSALPALVALIVVLLFRERLGLVPALGVALCIAAVWFTQSQGSLSAMATFRLNPGDGFVILSALAYSLYTALLRWRPEQITALGFVMALMLLGTGLLAPVALLEFLYSGARFPLDRAEVWLALLYVATFPSAIAALCWNRGIQLIGAARGGVFVTLIPLFAALLSWLLLGEALRLYHLLGLCGLVIGIVLVNARQRQV